jgi:Flp pilus assembly protein TadG
MSRRRKTSGGQAIVMVTLALFSMVGMMGLAVDLGWSYFVQKQAQSAADTAVLGAAQEAVARLGTTSDISGFRCTSAGTGAAQVDCQLTPIPCGSVTSTSNLHNGCLYAAANDFDPSKNSRQIVLMQASDVTDANRPPGVNRISYWVRARTIQTIPQLFSFISGNHNGTVAANATAAIAGSITPGSFYGMNQKGDCLFDSSGKPFDCGIDVQVSGGQGGMDCGAVKAKLCAPAGIILASSCDQSGPGCADAAGSTSGAASVWANSLLQMTGGKVTGNWTPPTPTYSSDAANFKDPTAPNPQPPLQATGTMASCGVTSSTNVSGQLGPYQYYHYTGTTANGKPKPDGLPITIGANATFSPSGTCPGYDSMANGLGGTKGSGSFPAYVFYGGVNQTGGTMTLGSGQYFMAGTTGTNVLTAANGTNIVGDASTGTMMVFTDGDYTGSLTTQRAALPNASLMPTLNQGTLYFKNANIDMTGLINSTVSNSSLPPAMDAYTGIVWWQDRRNSTVEYDPNGTVIDAPATAGELAANHVVNNSPGVLMDDGNANISLKGVYYQPRGAWLELKPGTAGLTGTGSGNKATQLPLQVITGALITDSGGGDTGVLLAGPTNPLLTYRAVLVQ